MSSVPHNFHAKRAVDRLGMAESADTEAINHAVLALAFEQHQRNRLAALTAAHRGLDLPTDLAALATEGA